MMRFPIKTLGNYEKSIAYCFARILRLEKAYRAKHILVHFCEIKQILFARIFEEILISFSLEKRFCKRGIPRAGGNPAYPKFEKN